MTKAERRRHTGSTGATRHVDIAPWLFQSLVCQFCVGRLMVVYAEPETSGIRRQKLFTHRVPRASRGRYIFMHTHIHTHTYIHTRTLREERNGRSCGVEGDSEGRSRLNVVTSSDVVTSAQVARGIGICRVSAYHRGVWSRRHARAAAVRDATAEGGDVWRRRRRCVLSRAEKQRRRGEK